MQLVVLVQVKYLFRDIKYDHLVAGRWGLEHNNISSSRKFAYYRLSSHRSCRCSCPLAPSRTIINLNHQNFSQEELLIKSDN